MCTYYSFTWEKTRSFLVKQAWEGLQLVSDCEVLEWAYPQLESYCADVSVYGS